ncbi:unnamed protein product [Chondrus crispus]|uniref:Secreted protein n=1 Tax=Chondrus crispus TaxID=2769 RepID=R7Q4Z0_CHOCR|nr:unnamed protein product [Chondrus crispus]CDF32500.1 unnamed protein product [Chondrus crispus]|eukprot:XP_005712165.1 unnamed protein product [Chondrus crispus]
MCVSPFLLFFCMRLLIADALNESNVIFIAGVTCPFCFLKPPFFILNLQTVSLSVQLPRRGNVLIVNRGSIFPMAPPCSLSGERLPEAPL